MKFSLTLGGEFDALRDEPSSVPEVMVFDAVLAEGEAEDVVGWDFLAALGLRDEVGGASIPGLVCPYLAVLQCLSGVVGIWGL